MLESHVAKGLFAMGKGGGKVATDLRVKLSRRVPGGHNYQTGETGFRLQYTLFIEFAGINLRNRFVRKSFVNLWTLIIALQTPLKLKVR